MEEIWKDIPSAPGYSITANGDIRKNRTGRIMKPFKNTSGYFQVGFQINKVRTRKLVHRLVMEAFVGDSTLPVNHKNGVKTDTRLDNLEYVTHSENTRHAIKAGLKTYHRGGKHHRSQFTDGEVCEIKKIIRIGLFRCKDIARAYGVGYYTILHIKRGSSWSHVP